MPNDLSTPLDVETLIMMQLCQPPLEKPATDVTWDELDLTSVYDSIVDRVEHELELRAANRDAGTTGYDSDGDKTIRLDIPPAVGKTWETMRRAFGE